MILDWWKKWTALRAAMWRKLNPIVHTTWYKILFWIALSALVVKFVDAQRGPDFPTFIRRIPVQAFTLPFFIISLPIISNYYESLRRRNEKVYDPNAPVIKQMARRTALAGWLFIATSVIISVGGVAFFINGISLPIWLVSGLFILLFFIGIMLTLRSREMRAGTWTPPEWMPPMDSLEQSNNSDKSD